MEQKTIAEDVKRYADGAKMNNNNGHEELGGDRGPGVQDVSSTSIKQRFIQHSTSQQKVIRPTTSALSMAPQTLSPIRSLEGRRYRDILRQESLSVSKENLNGVLISSKVSTRRLAIKKNKQLNEIKGVSVMLRFLGRCILIQLKLLSIFPFSFCNLSFG